MLLYLVCSDETAWRNSLQGTDQKLLMASDQRNAKQLGHTGQRLPRSVAHKFASPGANEAAEASACGDRGGCGGWAQSVVEEEDL